MTATTFCIVNEQVRANAIEAVKMAELGKVVQIMNKGKTPSQRNYFHKLLDLICKETGESKDRAKHLIKDKVLEKDVWTDKNGKRHERVVSSEELDTKQYAELIDYAIIVCDYLNIVYPDPKLYGISLDRT